MNTRQGRMSRERFLGTAGAVAVGAALPTGRAAARAGRQAAPAASAPAASAPSAPPRVRYRGVVYEVGEGEFPATGWNTARARGACAPSAAACGPTR